MTTEVPKDYEITPQENYSYDLFSEWWPSKWKGGAWICPNKHQIPKEKFDYGFHGGNKYGTFCPGCNRWVDRKLMKWDPIKKKCTMGYARRRSEFEEETENERNNKTVSKKLEGYDPKVSVKDKTRKEKKNGSC